MTRRILGSIKLGHELNLIAILSVAITGNFPGYAATGVEEDSLIIILAVQLHGLFF